MSKTITSPVKYFSGTVTLSDPLNMTQACAYEDAIQAVGALGESKTIFRIKRAWMPGILACVETWNLEHISQKPEFIPATPRKSSNELYLWLWNSIGELFEEAEIPNESGSPPVTG